MLVRLIKSILVAVVLLGATAVPACVGDCNGDRAVTVDELLLGVNIALGSAQVADCPAFDDDQSSSVTVDEVLAAVTGALLGCPTPIPTSTPTPTPTVNQPPIGPTPFVYYGFVGHPIAFAVGANDPEDGPLIYSVDGLPSGSTFDSTTGEFTWTPSADQIGPFYVPWQVEDGGAPPLVANGRLTFSIQPQDNCSLVTCDSATGCTADLPPVTETCCTADEPTRAAEPEADCPEGRLVVLGRNHEGGFGRLRNCDQFRVINRLQEDANMEFHIAARCINTDALVNVRVRVDMNRPGQGVTALLDQVSRVPVTPQPDGFAVRKGIRAQVSASAPFNDFQDAEANFFLEVRDAEGHVLDQSVRLRLTFTPIPDIVDPSPVPTPTQAL